MADLILGLDPGTRFAGFGVISVDGDDLGYIESGVIALNQGDPLALRLKVLHESLQAIFSRHRIHTTVVEKIFFGKNADSAFKLGHARGVCLMASAANGVGIEEYAAKYVKKCVTGTGGASKDHVQMIVLAALKMKPRAMTADASDALALAITHARLRDVNARMKCALNKESENEL
jgi:crossover junction endodeoxyribonuclease RuvC